MDFLALTLRKKSRDLQMPLALTRKKSVASTWSVNSRTFWKFHVRTSDKFINIIFMVQEGPVFDVWCKWKCYTWQWSASVESLGLECRWSVYGRTCMLLRASSPGYQVWRKELGTVGESHQRPLAWAAGTCILPTVLYWYHRIHHNSHSASYPGPSQQKGEICFFSPL